MNNNAEDTIAARRSRRHLCRKPLTRPPVNVRGTNGIFPPFPPDIQTRLTAGFAISEGAKNVLVANACLKC